MQVRKQVRTGHGITYWFQKKKHVYKTILVFKAMERLWII